jgi:hypothetical protein
VAALLVVVRSHGRDMTPPRSLVCCIEVVVADSLRPEVNRGSREYTSISKVPLKRGIMGLQLAELINVFAVEFRGKVR